MRFWQLLILVTTLGGGMWTAASEGAAVMGGCAPSGTGQRSARRLTYVRAAGHHHRVARCPKIPNRPLFVGPITLIFLGHL